MGEDLVLQWFRVKDKEPPEVGNIVIYNGGNYSFVTYLPPRRGDKFGDWRFDDGRTYKVKPTERWCEIDCLFFADSMDGKIVFKGQKVTA